MENKKYYQNEPKFNGAYSRNNLSKINDGTYVINLDEFKSIGTHCIALYVNHNNVTFFDRFRVEHIPKDIRKFIENKIVKTNVYRMQGNDSIICGYFCIEFIDSKLKGKILLGYTNLFSLNEYKKNDKIILKYFQ